MPTNSASSFGQLTLPGIIALIAMTATGANAADNDVRLVPQLAVGTAGVEPGLAMEWRGAGNPLIIVRPEILISEDFRLGAGGAVLFDITPGSKLPGRQAFAVGPRVVYHNADHAGWEADVMATWSYDLSDGAPPGYHAIGLLGAVGLYQDRNDHHYYRDHHDDHSDTEIGLTAGIFYSIRL